MTAPVADAAPTDAAADAMAALAETAAVVPSLAADRGALAAQLAADPIVAALPADVRAMLAGLWQTRADSESSVRTVFDQLVAELLATGAHADVITLARRAAADEVRHAAVCTELAAAYRGEPVPAASAAAVRLPDYVADPRLRAALHAINLCCIGETIATAFVEACMHDCAPDALRQVHGRHLADEIHHARVGWAHAASLTTSERAQLAERLPEILRAQVTAWESRIGELPEHGVPGHGYPPRVTLLATVHTAVRELVLPGFDYVGIATAAARAWFDAHAAQPPA